MKATCPDPIAFSTYASGATTSSSNRDYQDKAQYAFTGSVKEVFNRSADYRRRLVTQGD